MSFEIINSYDHWRLFSMDSSAPQNLEISFNIYIYIFVSKDNLVLELLLIWVYLFQKNIIGYNCLFFCLDSLLFSFLF